MSSTLRFSPTAFFYGLLPPIVFAAGALASPAIWPCCSPRQASCQPGTRVCNTLAAWQVPAEPAKSKNSCCWPDVCHPAAQPAHLSDSLFNAGFTLKKKDFFKNAPAIALFAVAGTLISTLVFGLLTYFLLVIHVVRRSAFGPAPLTECMLYGAPRLHCGRLRACTRKRTTLLYM